MRRLLKERRGEGFVDVCVLVLSVALVLALVVRIAPVFVAKQNLDVFADELVRTAEINGRVGSATSSKAAALREETGLASFPVTLTARATGVSEVYWK